MKKILGLIVLILSFMLVGCDFSNFTTDDNFTYVTPTHTETETTTTVTQHITDTILDTTSDVESTESTDLPMISVELNPGKDTVEIHTDWVDAGAVLIVDDQTYEMTTSSVVDTSMLGLYLVLYEYYFNDTRYVITRYVLVVDQTSPIASLKPGVDTIFVGEDWIDAGVIVNDNHTHSDNITITVEGEVDNQTPGVYQITYVIKDYIGNTTTLVRFVYVIDK